MNGYHIEETQKLKPARQRNAPLRRLDLTSIQLQSYLIYDKQQTNSHIGFIFIGNRQKQKTQGPGAHYRSTDVKDGLKRRQVQ